MLRMGEDENITYFMQRVNELVCSIRCAGGTLEELEIVAKVIRSLPTTYKHKATTRGDSDSDKCNHRHVDWYACYF